MLSKVSVPAGCKADGSSGFRMLTSSYQVPHQTDSLCRNRSLATWITAFVTAAVSTEELPPETSTN